MRKKRRPPTSGVAILWLLLFVNVSAGMWLSPVTAARKIRIEGSPLSQRANIASILASMKGVSCLRVDAFDIETKIQALPSIRTATLHRNIFGSAQLQIEAHVAIAQFENRAGLYLSDRGIVFKSLDLQESLPQVVPPPGFDAPQLSIVGAWDPGRAARACALAAALRIPYEDGEKILTFRGNGSVQLRVGGGAIVELGDSQKLERKFSVLEGLLKENGKLLAENSTINIVDPDRPTKR